MNRQCILNAALLAAVAAAAGWFSHTSSVRAAEAFPAPTAFQLQGTGPEAQLAIYDSESRTISVYQGVGGGSDVKQCSYQLQLARSGTAIRRTVCAPGRLP